MGNVEIQCSFYLIEDLGLSLCFSVFLELFDIEWLGIKTLLALLEAKYMYSWNNDSNVFS